MVCVFFCFQSLIYIFQYWPLFGVSWIAVSNKDKVGVLAQTIVKIQSAESMTAIAVKQCLMGPGWLRMLSVFVFSSPAVSENVGQVLSRPTHWVESSGSHLTCHSCLLIRHPVFKDQLELVTAKWSFMKSFSQFYLKKSLILRLYVHTDLPRHLLVKNCQTHRLITLHFKCSLTCCVVFLFCFGGVVVFSLWMQSLSIKIDWFTDQ